jgi:hypothetical protein
MTLLTTIKVATPSVTLTIDANAMKRVLRYRHESSSLYIANPSALDVRKQNLRSRNFRTYAALPEKVLKSKSNLYPLSTQFQSESKQAIAEHRGKVTALLVCDAEMHQLDDKETVSSAGFREATGTG